MSRDGKATRQRILESAGLLVMARGFGATSIDMVLDEAQVTKGAFFYHFKSKAQLAVALAESYTEQNDRFFAACAKAADRRHKDPLDRMLGYLDELADAFEKRPAAPGCLFAAFCYEADIFDKSLRRFMSQQMRLWRDHHLRRLEQIARKHPPYVEIDLGQLADAFLAAIEGGYVLGRVHGDTAAVARAVRQHRQYLEFVFDA
ncbi:MAG: TetR/AcrR family transcriptional regulator [Phycisphaeraceae bacterium]|nr:TetR/AcrR family transcriptional regulator [Phycisphaeraceae bacterium]